MFFFLWGFSESFSMQHFQYKHMQYGLAKLIIYVQYIATLKPKRAMSISKTLSDMRKEMLFYAFLWQ